MRMFSLKIKRFNLILVCILWGQSLLAQQFKIKEIGRPFINSYSRVDYGSGSSNYDGLQTPNGLIYIANLNGVMEFDGVNWRMLSGPKGDVPWGLEFDADGDIYLITKSHFGFFRPDKKGQMKYTSLMDRVPGGFDETGTFSEIHKLGDQLIIRARSKLLIVNTKTEDITVVPGSNSLASAFVKSGVYCVFDLENQLYQLVNDRLDPIGTPEFSSSAIRLAIPYMGDGVLVFNSSSEFYLETKDEYNIWKTDVDDLLKKSIVKSIISINNYVAIGTVSSGILVLDEGGRLVQKLDGTTGFNQLPVNKLFLDNKNNLWAAQRLGLSQVLLNSPYSILDRNYGLTTNINDIARVGSKVYFGMNDGIAYKDDKDQWQSVSDHKPFKKFDIYDRHVRAFQVADGKLFAGVEDGLILIDDEQTRWLYKEEGLLNGRVAIKNKDMVIFGSESGDLHLIAKVNGKWQHRWAIKGFNGPIDSIWELDDGDLWIVDSGVGIKRVGLNDRYDEVITIKTYDESSGLPGKSEARAYRTRRGLAFLTLNGIYKYNPQVDRFEPDSIYGNHLKGSKPIRFTELKDGSIMAFLKSGDQYEFKFLRREGNTFILEPNHQFISETYPNVIGSLESNQAWIGGFPAIHYNPQMEISPIPNGQAFIRNVSVSNKNDSVLFAGHGISIAPELHHTENAIRIDFGSNFFDRPSQVLYQSYLEGTGETWSNWSSEGFRSYTNLPHGNYKMRVRAQNIYGEIGKESIYAFSILSPWYLSGLAYVVYALMIAFLIWLLLMFNARRLQQKNKVLEGLVQERTQEVKKQNVQLEERNDRIETLFKEVHHRVKNNLQLISSLLNMQQEWSSTEDPAKAIEDSRSRVVAMSMIHQFLYRTDDISSIYFKQYAEELASKLDDIQVERVNYQLHTDFDEDYNFGIDTSISLGLILNELITNSYKHAVLNKRDLEINLKVVALNKDFFKMIYTDNGEEIKTPFKEVVKKGFGLRLASRLSRQLQGSFEYEYANGNQFSVTFASEEARLAMADD